MLEHRGITLALQLAMLTTLFHCAACESGLDFLFNRRFFPLCSICSESLIPCPALCPHCASPLCLNTPGISDPQTKCSQSDVPSCTRPWVQKPEIDSYTAAYLLLKPCYQVLKKWKTRRGLLFDRKILKDYPYPELKTRLLNLKTRGAKAIIPIPQKFHRAWQMRGSRALRIAEWVREMTDLPILPLLTPPPSYLSTSERKRQAEMTYQERLENRVLLGIIPHSLFQTQPSIILVDDFMTSGRTLSQAATLLKKHGVLEVHTFCLGIRVHQANQVS